MVPQSIAVLGGGITGLSAAFHLSRRFPAAQITIINKDVRFGGWVRSERSRITFRGESGEQEEADVLLEAGPRTLRPNARSVLELVCLSLCPILLDLSPSLITVPKTSLTAKNRFLHIPGSAGIHRVPSSFSDLITSFGTSNAHLGRVLLSSVINEPLKRWNRPPGAEDESVDEFLSRRFGENFSRIFGSALAHGIYAADARTLSLRSAFPSLWEAEERGRGSIVLGLLRPPDSSQLKDDDATYELGGIQDTMRDVSVYSFTDGLATLVRALVRSLRENPNVCMYGGVDVMGLRINPWNKRFELVQVTISSRETLFPTHVVSTLPLFQLRTIISPATPIPHLTANTYSSVTVVNFVFASPSSSSRAFHPEGFGFLVPRPVEGYAKAGRTGILGCVFDSASTASQDTSGQAIVKMTVMLGGPYASRSPSQIDIPPVLDELSSQLGRPLPPPLLVRVHGNAHCIPLYAVGHSQRMEELKRVLEGEPWVGRMAVIGAGVGGVSVGDCVEAGRNVGRGWS